MNNAVYGKTKENVRNRIDVKLVSNKKKIFKIDIQTKLYLKQNIWQWFSRTSKNKVTLTLNKPACIRMCILELSKVLMNEVHYYYIKNKYGNNSRVLFTDTGSLMYEIVSIK